MSGIKFIRLTHIQQNGIIRQFHFSSFRADTPDEHSYKNHQYYNYCFSSHNHMISLSLYSINHNSCSFD